MFARFVVSVNKAWAHAEKPVAVTPVLVARAWSSARGGGGGG